MDLLDHAEIARLRAAPLTSTRGGAKEAVPGFGSFSRSRALRRTDLDGAAADLFGWRVHERAGLRVRASGPVAIDAVVEMRLGIGRASLRVPCRVVAVVEAPMRRGFSYGTLPGHPVSGEEQFLLEQDPDGGLDFTVSAVSRHATLLARVGGPVTSAVQRLMTDRYLRAPDRLAPRG